MPTALALSAAFHLVLVVRILPTGSPRKIVLPASAPRMRICVVDIL